MDENNGVRTWKALLHESVSKQAVPFARRSYAANG